MKVLIAYYSRTKGTEAVAEALRKEFKTRGHSVDMEKIKPKKEHSFWGWWYLRTIRGDCDIFVPEIQDVSNYDVVCIGSPNWTRLSLPMARYLKEIKGLRYKNVGFFATTFFSPAFEWYILSAFLLDITFSKLIAEKGGRIINSILLSSTFKRQNITSEWGKKLIKKFCAKTESPIYSLKKYFLEQKEIENTRFLVVLFSIILLFSFIFQIFSPIFKVQALTWSEYFFLFLIEFFAYFAMLMILAGRLFVPLGKYLASLALVAGTTIAALFLLPLFWGPIILGYVLILILFSLFRDLRVIFFTGAATVFAYFYLLLNYPFKSVLFPALDLSFILLSACTIGIIAKNLQDHYADLLDAQEEIESSRATLEIRVMARTKELKEFSKSLEIKVKERTKEIREKIEELEKFNKLAVGRELKMVELKKEIEKLKIELKKCQK